MERKSLEKELKLKEKLETCEELNYNGKKCGDRFDSPLGLVKHQRSVHKILEAHNPLIVATVELKGPDFRSLDGEIVFLKMASYKKDKLCILHVVEYKFWVRVWVTQADPSVDPKKIIPVKITVPAPHLDKNKQEKLYQFTGKILPFGTYSFKSDWPVEYFDVPKSFLRQYYEKRGEGRFGLRILFAIGSYDKKEVYTEENGEEILVLELSEQGGEWKEEGLSGEREVETEIKIGSSKVKEDDGGDDQVIMRPFYETYE